jgi:transcriptional regulator with XRE-family HTH domain
MQSQLSSSKPAKPGARIRRQRKRKKWTQERLAKQMELEALKRGYPPPKTASFQTYVSRWERHLQVPDETNRRLVAAALKVEVSDLGLTEDPDFVWISAGET